MWQLLADTPGTATSIEGIFLQYGLIGAVALILGFYARSQIRATEARAQRLEEDNRRLYQIMFDQMIPTLTKANDTIGLATEMFAEEKHQREKQAAVEEARRLMAEERKRLDGTTP